MAKAQTTTRRASAPKPPPGSSESLRRETEKLESATALLNAAKVVERELTAPAAMAFAALRNLEVPLHDLNQLVTIIQAWTSGQNFYWPDATQDDDTNRERSRQIGRLLFALDEIAKRAADVSERFYEASKPYRRAAQ